MRVIQDLSASRDLNTVMDIVRHSARDLTDPTGRVCFKDGDLCYYAEEMQSHRFGRDTVSR